MENLLVLLHKDGGNDCGLGSNWESLKRQRNLAGLKECWSAIVLLLYLMTCSALDSVYAKHLGRDAVYSVELGSRTSRDRLVLLQCNIGHWLLVLCNDRTGISYSIAVHVCHHTNHHLHVSHLH